jgi:hypothetical protein
MTGEVIPMYFEPFLRSSITYNLSIVPMHVVNLHILSRV